MFNNILENINGDNKVAEANNTTIQFLLLITSIITILFLILNFKQQQNQIKSNKRDTEFNRALELIEKYLKLIDISTLKTREKVLSNNLNLILSLDLLINEEKLSTPENIINLGKYAVNSRGQIVVYLNQINATYALIIKLVYNPLFTKDEIIILSEFVCNHSYREIYNDIIRLDTYIVSELPKYKDMIIEYFKVYNKDGIKEYEKTKKEFESLKERLSLYYILFDNRDSDQYESNVKTIRKYFKL
ncbi:hypothetical protein GCM10011516_27220 [Sphingobacterium cellulitidis]|uniref:Uncharacterized protein n=1 Tax=Sphingobacterium cellulitidis TaxID=1768011 RepID=A0A8H9G0D8_9SPHI|nr:hypothetical protein GCM10011516_27220 [Sphingobacterium soli]